MSHYHNKLLATRIVRSLAGNSDVVRVILGYATRCDTHEASILQGVDILSTAVAHTCAYATYKLVYGLGKLALEGHTAHDTLGHELHDITLGALLEVAVCRASLHGVDRAHATVCLELTAVVDDGLAW